MDPYPSRDFPAADAALLSLWQPVQASGTPMDLATDCLVVLENTIDYLRLAQLNVAEGSQMHEFVSNGIEVAEDQLGAG